MELHFSNTGIPCLKTVKQDVQTQEQTQEVKLTEGLPDMGRVLGVWGQSVLRGKQWQGEEATVSCGAMVWVLYAPEDGSYPRMVETWIPMELRWQIPGTKQEGKLWANCLLRSVDARMTGPRKLMVRANMAVRMQAYCPDKIEVSQPEGVPEDVQLLRKTYQVCLPVEAGEKSFQLDEELELPASCPKARSFLQARLYPRIVDKRVMSDKVVFRGVADLHTVYQGQDEGLYGWNFEVPFSQYADLDDSYSEEASVLLMPQVTGLETDADEEGRIRLKAGLTCQYVTCDRKDVQVATDAYSPVRKVEPQVQTLILPAIESMDTQTLLLQHTMSADGMPVDVSVLCDQVRKQSLPEQVRLEIPALGQILYYDVEGGIQSTASRWEDSIYTEPYADGNVEVNILPTGQCSAEPTEGGMSVETNVILETVVTSTKGLPMVTGLEMGQPMPKDPNRPSVILRRVGPEGLWGMAKGAGSSVDAICKANGLTEEPEEGRMLLIPIE